MLFNSFAFGFFLLVASLLYWLVFNRGQRMRNIFLFTAGYFFYGCWDWRFLFLIVFITAVDFVFGRLIHDTENQSSRKWLLTVALVLNLGTLGFFKYFNFFIVTANALLDLIGLGSSLHTLQIILPVGISFFTFQGLSYVIDIYRRQLKPTRDVVAFATFVAFFPQLVAGPIERACNLLPQFLDSIDRKPFVYEDVRRGLVFIAIGLFKKIVIADRLAIFVDAVYAHPTAGWPAMVAVIFFCFQLYLDFSAYSQIAIGTAQLLGYRLSANFLRPYLATNFRAFWSRWHITLTTWFRDYLYIPLGGNRLGKTRMLMNTMIVFMVSGLWHGASWNFVIWGALNGLSLIVFDRWLGLNPKNAAAKMASALFVTAYWALTLIFFRATTFGNALAMFGSLGFSNADMIYSFGLNAVEFRFVCGMVAVLMAVELMEEIGKERFTQFFYGRFWPLRWAVYITLVLSTIYFGIYGNGSDNNFIYFQF